MRKHAWATRLKLALGSIFDNSQGFARTPCPWGHRGRQGRRQSRICFPRQLGLCRITRQKPSHPYTFSSCNLREPRRPPAPGGCRSGKQELPPSLGSPTPPRSPVTTTAIPASTSTLNTTAGTRHANLPLPEGEYE